MAASTISLDDFFESVDDSPVPIQRDTPLFKLVLGAGASRSAGIPTANEMTALMRELIAGHGFPLEDEGPDGLTFAQAIGTIIEYADVELVRDFILQCIRRGSREPNITHLVAANLACCGFFNTIVTTNFDDLALAAFWQLPFDENYQEPYVVYDPKTLRPRTVELGVGVPIIVKAHGHHTQYELGLLDHQFAAFAPGVKRAMGWQSPPALGFMVVGSSGSFPDGVIAALGEKRITRGLPIYWFFRDKLAERLPEPLGKLTQVSDVRFVRCDDSDDLFLRLWHAVDGAAPVLDANDLFTPATVSQQIDVKDSEPDTPWAFDQTGNVPESREAQRAALGVPAIRQTVWPLLQAIDAWDRDLLSYDCLPANVQKPTLRGAEVYFDGREAKQIQTLRDVVSQRLPWTRRNLKLLQLALDETTDPRLSYELLSTIEAIRSPRSGPTNASAP